MRQKSSRPRHASRIASIASLVVVMGALLAGAVLAAGGHHARPHRAAAPRLSMFPHPLARRAHITAVPGMPPAGPRVRILSTSTSDLPPASAELVASADGDEIYAWQPSSTEEQRPIVSRLGPGPKVCVMEREVAAGIVGVACHLNSTLEQVGTVTVSLPSRSNPTLGVTAVVPSAVTTVVATDRDGTSDHVRVEDGVVIIRDSQLASVSYPLANGSTHTVNVEEIAAASEQAAPPPPPSPND
jgi:hypothetical protein